MGRTVDIGRRIELVSMDPHFHNISIGLYCQSRPAGPEFLIHTYSSFEGSRERVESAARAMAILGGMVLDPQNPCALHFPCRAEHELAIKRVFLEACKLDPDQPVESRPLAIFDKKSAGWIVVDSLGNGAYQLAAEGTEKADRRLAAVAGGLVKLGEMADQGADKVAFPCGQAHDALVGLLLVRALNVRSVLREQEQVAGRGTLASPSQQNR